MTSYLQQSLGRHYDYAGVLWLGVLKFFSDKLKLPFKNKANNWQKDHDYFCSELCYEAFHVGGGLDIVPEISEAEITSPADISRSKVLERVSELIPN